jgi:hypothetical protein
MLRSKATLANRKGQGFVAYAILIIIVAASVVAMTAYIYGAVNARLSQEHEELDYYKAER